MRLLRTKVVLILTLLPAISLAETVIIKQVKPNETIITPTSTETVVTPTTTETVVTPVRTTTTSLISPKTMIVTPMPEVKEVIATPAGYANCFTVDSGWVQNEWIPSHQVCQYDNLPDRVAWIEGYWACTKYKIDEGICTSWDWRKGHWTNRLVIY